MTEPAGTIGSVAEPAMSWYAVRCIFAKGWPPEEPSRYEERITLWRASSADEAIARAEAEAREYAATIYEAPDEFLGLAQSYQLSDEPGDGAEVFSLIRDSELSSETYLDTFFATGRERIATRILDDPDDLQ